MRISEDIGKNGPLNVLEASKRSKKMWEASTTFEDQPTLERLKTTGSVEEWTNHLEPMALRQRTSKNVSHVT